MMSDIRTDTSPDSMRSAIRENYIAFWQLLAESGLIYVRGTPELVTYGPVREPSAFRHGVLIAQFGDDADHRIDGTLTTLGFPDEMVFWWELPGTTPADMGERLAHRGFTKRDDLPGMAVELERVRWQVGPPEVTIETVHDAETFRVLNETAAAGLGQPADVADFLYRAYCEVGFGDDRWIPYLAWMDGEPAGTTILVLGTGVAGIYAVAVREEARRRGVGTALILAALGDARERGYSIATLRSSQMGYPMYRRLGFEEYCRIPLWVWVPGHVT